MCKDMAWPPRLYLGYCGFKVRICHDGNKWPRLTYLINLSGLFILGMGILLFLVEMTMSVLFFECNKT